MAEAYRELTVQYVSRDTMKRRYLEAKNRIKSVRQIEELTRLKPNMATLR